jgi:hypothetical protein
VKPRFRSRPSILNCLDRLPCGHVQVLIKARDPGFECQRRVVVANDNTIAPFVSSLQNMLDTDSQVIAQADVS